MYILHGLVRLITPRNNTELTSPNECSALLPTRQNDGNLSSDEQPSFTRGKRYKSFLRSQRAVKLCMLFVAIYYMAAVVGFSFLVEKWPVDVSLYFGTVIVTTIGYGGLEPSTNLGHLYTVCLGLYGLTLLGIFLGIAGQYIIEAQKEAIEKSRKRIRRTLLQAVKHKNTSSEDWDAVINANRERPINEEILEVVALEAPIICIILALSSAVGYVEGWSWYQSLYFAVGYGDYEPQKTVNRIACCFLLPLSVAVLGELLSRIAWTYMNHQIRIEEKQFLSRSMSLSDVEVMDTNRDGVVDKGEFLAFILVALQKVAKSDIDELLAVFDHLDVNKSGTISKEDILSKACHQELKNYLEGRGRQKGDQASGKHSNSRNFISIAPAEC